MSDLQVCVFIFLLTLTHPPTHSHQPVHYNHIKDRDGPLQLLSNGSPGSPQRVEDHHINRSACLELFTEHSGLTL